MIPKEIKADLHRVLPGPFSWRRFAQGLKNQGFRYLVFARLKGCPNWRVLRPIFYVVVRHYMYKYGFQVPVGKIGGGLYLGHFGTVVVSVNAAIGRDCNIAHNVTIGAARGGRSGAPKIGNRVWIGTGAVIVGDISVGDDVLIAPNAYVNCDVPSNSVVLGNPAVISAKPNPTADYINNRFYN